MQDLIENALLFLTYIGLFVGLFILYFVICVVLGMGIEMVLGWMGKDVVDWYWTGVGLVAMLGAVVGTKSSKD